MATTTVRRTAKQAREVKFDVDVESRIERDFCFSLPEDFGFDNEDADDIERELWRMNPEPSSVQTPVADGCGGLVYDQFVATFIDCSATDETILSEIRQAVQRALRPRTWRL